MANEKKIALLFKQFHEIFRSKPIGVRNQSYFTDALMHREALKGEGLKTPAYPEVNAWRFS